jgi:hypothetical protein
VLHLPGEFAEAVALSTRVFCQLAKTHDQFVKMETASRLNEKRFAKTFQIGDKVKVREIKAVLLLGGMLPQLLMRTAS